MNLGRIKVAEAAAILHVSQQFVRVAMQQGVLPIGVAVKMSSHWTYQISPRKLADYTGTDIESELKQLRVTQGQGKGKVNEI